MIKNTENAHERFQFLAKLKVLVAATGFEPTTT